MKAGASGWPRRNFLRQLALAVTSLSASSHVGAELRAHLDSPETNARYDAAVKRLTSGRAIETTHQIALSVPAVAEDGAVVPITIETTLPSCDCIAILAKANPTPLIASFQFASPALPFVSLRVRLNATGDVVVLARAEHRWFMARQAVRVVVGGCG